jgi:cytochrome c oxidase assembly protein subunit 15
LNASAQTTNDPWLHRFAVLTAIITFFLLGIGGLVTSHEAGMSVPDWPTSYGYNMFALPIKFWKGGAFFEHSHRLLASGAGFLTTVLAVWLWLKDPRKWMKWLGVVAFLLVVAQGVLGGLRVTLKMDGLGVIHGVVAQSFFILICAIALFTSRFWQKLENSQQPTSNNQHPTAGDRPNAGRLDVGCSMLNVGCSLRWLVLATTVLIFCQLILGATMRGQHAGLAIPDFPLAYHKLWPDTGADAVARYNADRVEVISVNPITAFQIELQMVHRCVALAIGILVAFCAWLSLKWLGGKNPLAKLAIFWLALVVCQIALGAWTVWSNKAADVATAHVLLGALSLVTGALWWVIAFGRRDGATKIAPVKTISGAFEASPAMAANK